MTRDDFQNIASTIPHQPGVYQFIDKDGKALYVGKAKDLKNRVSSYFNSQKHQINKTKVMLKNAKSIKFTLVDTESDAFLLENSLIKKFQPRYNVDLKDGKSYTYICIKNEPFPRVFFTRKIIRDGSIYFGPYTSKWRARILLDLIKDLFPLRTCNLNLSPENISTGKYKICLEYHIKNCNGPCEGLEQEPEYLDRIEHVKNVLGGQFKAVKNHLIKNMNCASGELDFERAQDWKSKLVAFENYQSKSTVANIRIRDVDVFTISEEGASAYVHYMKVTNGAVINTYTAEIETKIAEDLDDLLAYAVHGIRNKFGSVAPEVLVPMPISFGRDDVRITVPKRGDKRKLLELSEKNLAFYQLQRKKEKLSQKNRKPFMERILNAVANDLHMKELPYHIECFDNSNIQGAHPVASCVVFKNGKQSKIDYRHYNIKSVHKPDDFASMEEVVYRRYRRSLEEDIPLPQLVIIDGGKGQLTAAMNSMKILGINEKVTVIGIAKRLEEIFFPDDPLPLYINKKSESLRLIQQIRNEAHRFAVTFHRNKRSQKFTESELLQIRGIGPTTTEKLLRKFKSIHKLKEASQVEIEQIIGKVKTGSILSYFKAGDR